ncbi:unnamed protein product [Miscanthus lutarioriparius]|uniref:Uncharacterized protein n=1 Tax=Miscanthus lutarioriparius TaxID=422564 RepID=A0A811PI36_9POAL|nr:unnamed protein product [Miscanthus lutarioriparius]
MPRASGVSNPPAAAATASAAAAASSRNVSRNAGHSGPSCSAPVYQLFRPVTRSMTCGSDPIVASPGFKHSVSCFTIDCHSCPDPSKVTSSGWKPLTQPVALNEERKCASLTINPTAKRSRVASSRAVKDSINHSASKANSNVASGKKYRDEEIVSLGDQSDGAVMPSPTKKLQICKGLSDAPSIRKSTIRILGVKGAALPPTGKSQIETGKSFANAPAEVISASTNEISQSDNAAVPSLAQQLQPDTAKNSSVTMHIHETSKVNQLAATVATLPRPILQNDYNKKPSYVPIMANQASGLAGATAPLITPKLEIGNMKDSSNPLSNPAYTRALLIKQQEQLLQQFKLGSSQQQRQEQQLYIKGPALFENDDPPPVEPLGTRCQLCKLDIAFRPQGDAGRDANAPPVVAVLACHHVFHSSWPQRIRVSANMATGEVVVAGGERGSSQAWRSPFRLNPPGFSGSQGDQDREINGLNEQLEEDSRVLELLQKQLADERKKRAEIEKENSMLHEQVTMLMNMLDENEGFDEDGEAPQPDSFD